MYTAGASARAPDHHASTRGPSTVGTRETAARAPAPTRATGWCAQAPVQRLQERRSAVSARARRGGPWPPCVVGREFAADPHALFIAIFTGNTTALPARSANNAPPQNQDQLWCTQKQARKRTHAHACRRPGTHTRSTWRWSSFSWGSRALGGRMRTGTRWSLSPTRSWRKTFGATSLDA